MTFLSFCWNCGVNFRTDNVAEDTCPECREKLNRTLATQLKQAPVFRAIAERVAAILRR